MPDTAAPSATGVPPWEAKRNGSKPARRRYLTWLLVAAVVGLLALGFVPKPIEVEVTTAARGALTVQVTEDGKTRIRNRYVVSSPLAGQLRRVALKAGDAVKAGVTIVAVVEPAAAPLLDPRAKAQAEARVSAAAAGKLQAEQSYEMAKTAADFAVANWERMKNVTGGNSISITERDNAQRDALMRQREMAASEFARSVAAFELEQAKAALLQFSDGAQSGAALEIHSPVSGVVLRVQQESAVVVTPGSPILEVGDPGDIEIEAEILSRDAVAIKPGTEVLVEQWGGEPLKAKVRRIEPAAFTKISALGVEEQRVLVLSDLIDPPAAARMMGDRFRVEVKISIWHTDSTLLVPAGALFREGPDWKTYLFDGGKAKKIMVETGRTDGRRTEVLKGLPEGAEVLLHPPDTVLDGSAVKKRG